MKLIFLIITVLSGTISINGWENHSNYTGFLKYVRENFKPSETIKKECEWQYALVAVNTDANNKVVRYSLLNNAPDDFKNDFKFLLGYKFPKNLHINQHPVVFCISIENEKKACESSRKQYSPSEVLGRVFTNLTPLFKSDPKTIFLPDIVQVAYSFDPLR